MQVSDLITLMGTLSVGSDNVTPSERAIFLQYLNLAHFQLYQETSTWNDDLLVEETLRTSAELPIITLSQIPFVMIGVFDNTNKRTLSQKSIQDLIIEDPSFSATGKPKSFYLIKDQLNFYPVPSDILEVKAWYTPQPTSLKDNSEEIDIPYPLAFHPILVDGALYYLFQQEGGFKNTVKEGEARERWNNGKSFLLSYFYSRRPDSLSTFSNV
jgi:hypothetical protein